MNPSPALLVLNRRDPAHPMAGGAEVYLREVVRGFLDRGWRVDWFSAHVPGAAAIESPVPGLTHRRAGSEWTVHLAGRAFAKAHAADYRCILDVFNGTGFFTAGLPNSRLLVFQLYGTEFWCAEFGPPGRMAAALERHWLRAWRGRPAATISNSTRADLAGLGVAAKVIHVGLSLDVAAEPPARTGPPLLACVGRLRATKNPADALHAFRDIRRALPDARLCVAGRGPQENVLRETYGRDPGVEFLGFVDDVRKRDLLGRAHLVLIPSLREGWNMVVTEAAALGAPCVAYNVPGVRDAVVDGVTGVLVPAGDRTALARAALDLLHDPARLQALGHAAWARAKEFTWDRTREDFFVWATGA